MSPEFKRGLSAIFQRRKGRSSVVGTPIFIGVTDEVGVEVARIGGDFASEPRRCLDGFGFGGDFHLSDDEPFVVAVEDIDFPGPAAESFATKACGFALFGFVVWNPPCIGIFDA